MPDIDPRAVMAASNNADVYEAVLTAHGVPYRRTPFALLVEGAPPPYYSNMTTLSPHEVERQTVALRELDSGGDRAFGIKDSFCRIDLDSAGFEVLFEAQWLWREGNAMTNEPDPAGWIRVTDGGDLAAWEQSWKRYGSPTERRMFPASMLQRRDLAFFGRPGDDGFSAGCIANLSADCVGLSNVFSATDDPADTAAAAHVTAAFGSGLPVVGYDRGEPLNAMLACGFAAVGQLRVLVKARD